MLSDRSCCKFDPLYPRKALIDPSVTVEKPCLSYFFVLSSILKTLDLRIAPQYKYLLALSSQGLALLSFTEHLQILLSVSIGT